MLRPSRKITLYASQQSSMIGTSQFYIIRYSAIPANGSFRSVAAKQC